MEGLRFVRGEHLSVAEGLFLPAADIVGLIWKHLTEGTPQELRGYTPDLLKSDFVLLYDEQQGLFALFASMSASASIPTWGSKKDFVGEAAAEVSDFLAGRDCVDVSGLPLAEGVFEAHGFQRGPALIGRYPWGYDDAAKAEQVRLTKAAAEVIWKWADQERAAVENSRIFLSHRGVNKALVEKVEAAMRDLGLRPWLDKLDLPVGEELVRGVDSAFEHCSAAVFFISGDFVDDGVIAREVTRALHEATIRPTGFKIIPLVLAQHGGSDSQVPRNLQTLKWETVEDIDILPTILRALPGPVQKQVKWSRNAR